MQKVYIVAAKRSAIGSFAGGLSTVTAPALGAAVARDVLQSAGVSGDKLDEVIVGNILPAGCGQGVARQVAILAGVPVEVPAWGISMACGSGMKAVMTAAANVATGMGDLYLAGGTESMSLAPYLLPGARQGLRMGNKEIVDHMVYDALTDAFENTHMGITAENIAKRYGITREEQDAFAFASQEKAIRAVDAGAFRAEITPITVKVRKEEVVFDTDEYPNRKTSLEKLAALKPAFLPGGTVTAGNASGINDGAAFLLIASERALKEHNLTPLAELVAWGQGGVEPNCMRWIASYPDVLRPGLDFDPGEPPETDGLVGCWQYASDGQVPGYAGNLDVDHFFGSVGAWQAYAGVPSSGQPDPSPSQSVLEKR